MKIHLKSYLGFIKRLVTTYYYSIRRLFYTFHPNVNEKTLLHLGCGPINISGYTNIDIKPFPHVHFVHDAFPLEMFDKDTFDLVYASHILEHYAIPDVPMVLKEWYRVLKPNGVLRLGVPNLQTILEIYNNTLSIEEIQGPLMGGQTDQYNFHKSVYDKKYLEKLLLSIGFQMVRPWDAALVNDHDFKDTTSNLWHIGDNYYAISLNLEAVK